MCFQTRRKRENGRNRKSMLVQWLTQGSGTSNFQIESSLCVCVCPLGLVGTYMLCVYHSNMVAEIERVQLSLL